MQLIRLLANRLEALNDIDKSFAYRAYASMFFTAIYLIIRNASLDPIPSVIWKAQHTLTPRALITRLDKSWLFVKTSTS